MTGFLCGMLMEISLSMSAINMYKNLYSVYCIFFSILRESGVQDQ